MIGAGAYGKVRVAIEKDTKKEYAIKYVTKKEIIKRDIGKYMVFERRLLEILSYPLIVNLRYSFQDDLRIYMVLDLLLGGDLKFHLSQKQKFTENDIIVYAAEIGSCLNFLHSRNIVHRDIKPGNLILDMEGHMHLTDFNAAGILPENEGTMHTFCGTVKYSAPEMYSKDGYRETGDWFSLGIVLYEIIYGENPFTLAGAKKDDDYQEMIASKKAVSFPSNDYSEELSDLVYKLLKKDSNARLGSGKSGYSDFQSHPVFEGLDWEKVATKELHVNFKPKKDERNYDKMHYFDDVANEKPLVYRRPRLEYEKLKPAEKFIVDEYEYFSGEGSKNMSLLIRKQRMLSKLNSFDG